MFLFATASRLTLRWLLHSFALRWLSLCSLALGNLTLRWLLRSFALWSGLALGNLTLRWLSFCWHVCTPPFIFELVHESSEFPPCASCTSGYKYFIAKFFLQQ